MLPRIDNRIRLEDSYIPDKEEVLLDIEEEDNALNCHSEKLPIAFVLISNICHDGSSNYMCDFDIVLVGN
jgi:hypothetical protein